MEKELRTDTILDSWYFGLPSTFVNHTSFCSYGMDTPRNWPQNILLVSAKQGASTPFPHMLNILQSHKIASFWKKKKLNYFYLLLATKIGSGP